jgi:hypothetical protein
MDTSRKLCVFENNSIEDEKRGKPLFYQGKFFYAVHKSQYKKLVARMTRMARVCGSHDSRLWLA